MYRIRRFGVIRTATVVAVIYALVVGIILIPFLIFGALLGASTADSGRGVLAGAGLAFALVIGVLIVALYAALGWLFTALACLLYNLAARWVGGIEVSVEAVPAPPAQVAPTSGWGVQPPPDPAA